MHKNLLPGIIPGFAVLIIFFITGAASATEIVFSPDKNISLIISVQEKPSPYPQKERLYYSIYFQDKKIVKDSPLGLTFFNNPPIGTDLRLYNIRKKRIKGSFVPVSGRTDTSYIEYNQILLYLQEKRPPFRFFTIEFVLSNYGAAFRYHLPLQQNMSVKDIKQEDTGFYLSGDYTTILPFISDNKKPEAFGYTDLPISQINNTLSIIPPVLIQTNQKIWLEITETNRKNRCFMELKTTPHIRYSFSVRPYAQYEGKINTSAFTAWRVVLISKNPGTFAYSNFINLLNQQPAAKDVSWIKRGLYFNFQGNLDSDSLLHTIDFCEKNKINYIRIPMQANPNSAQIQNIVSLAANKNIDIILNTSQSYLTENCIKKMSYMKKTGISGIFVDMCREYKNGRLISASEILENAAINNLIVGFTGTGNFSGLSAVYPNFLSFVPNLKYLPHKIKMDKYLILTTIPYSYAISTPLDLCAVYYDSLNALHKNNAFDISSILALNVLTNSPLKMWNNNLFVSEFKDFLNNLPSVWDKTIFIDGKPGKFIILARRKGSTWYLSALSNSYKKILNIPLSFLGSSDKPYEASVYFKHYRKHKGKNPTVAAEHLTIKPSENLNVNLNPGGGYIAVIKPADK